MNSFDYSILIYIQSFADFFLLPALFLDQLGSLKGYILFLLIILFYFDYRLSVRAVILLSISFIFNSMLKMNLRMLRPFEIESSIHDLSQSSKFIGYGMPSGHAQSASSLFYIFLPQIKFLIIKLLLFTLVLLVGLSRIYLGLHTPTQVLIGFVLGIFIIYLTDLFTKTDFYTSLLTMSSRFKITAVTSLSLLITLGAISNLLIFNDISISSPMIYLQAKDLFSGAAFLGGTSSAAILLESRYRVIYNHYTFAGFIRTLIGVSILLFIFTPLYLGLKQLASVQYSTPMLYISFLYCNYILFYLFSVTGFYFIQHLFNRLGLVRFEKNDRTKTDASF